MANTPDYDPRPEEYRATHGLGLRSDRVSGVILICLGVFFSLQGAGGLLWGVVVYTLFALQGKSASAPASTVESFTSMSQIMLIHMPFELAGAMALVVCGVQLFRGSDRARRIARWTVLAGVMWLLVFNLHIFLVIYPSYQSQPMGPFNSPMAKLVWMVISGVGNVGIVSVVVAFLLYILSRPKQTRTLPSDESE